jgi:hypothetical protein
MRLPIVLEISELVEIKLRLGSVLGLLNMSLGRLSDIETIVRRNYCDFECIGRPPGSAFPKSEILDSEPFNRIEEAYNIVFDLSSRLNKIEEIMKGKDQ